MVSGAGRQKVTYRTGSRRARRKAKAADGSDFDQDYWEQVGTKSESVIQSFRNSYDPNPALPPPETSTSRGCGGLPNWELIAATMVMGLYSFEILFWMMTAGRVFWISCPTVGSKATR